MARVDSLMAQRDQLATDVRAMADNIAGGAVQVAGSSASGGSPLRQFNPRLGDS
jgi:hypothetical protein